jgi:hypothetical protein
LRQLAGDRQPEAGTTVLPGGRAVGLLEGAEDLAEFVRRNADPRVLHLEAH